jgi:hypothetical protein
MMNSDGYYKKVNDFPVPVPEFIEPVFVKTGYINSGTGEFGK